MPTELRFAFFGEDQVVRSLDNFVERSSDMRPAWDEIEDSFRAHEEEWFDSQGGGSWPTLSRNYAAWKDRHFPGEPTLVLTGMMRDSVLKPDIAVKEPTFAEFGTGDPVAAYHQAGGGRLPRRRVIDLDDTEREKWVRIVQEHLVKEDRR